MDNSAPAMARRFSPLKIPDWDALLMSHPDFSFFHGTAWLRVLVESYGFRPEFFGLGPAEKIDAVLPLVETDSWLRGRRAIALPFTDECPPLVAAGETFSKLFSAAVEHGKSRGWRSIELRGGRNLFPGPVPASLSFYGHEVELFSDEKVMFDKLDGSMRQAVRKAGKEGVKVGFFQSTEALEVFYRLQCLTRKRHGLPPQPYAFFMNIHRHILSKGLGTIAIADHLGEKIAASVYFFMGGRAIYKYGASDYARQNLRGTSLVMWEAMKWLAGQDIKSLHLGKTARANEGLRRFKLNLGAREKVVDYVKFDLRSGSFVTEKDAITGWHNHVFSRMPGFLARTAGRMLYKHWA
jgi:hypothetical protein